MLYPFITKLEKNMRTSQKNGFSPKAAALGEAQT